MVSYKINSVKTFMNDLLINDKFDNFLVTEVSITTFNTFTLEGLIHKSYFSDEEYDQLPDKQISSWKSVKSICFSLIKGKKLPGKFKIILKLSSESAHKLIESNDINYNFNDISGLYLNLKFENNNLTCVTGTSLNIFSLDKTLEKLWDEQIEEILNVYDIEI